MAEPKRILIVDDDADVHGLLRAALETPDRRIDSAYDGPTGLRFAKDAPYDLVLTFSYFGKPFTVSAVTDMVERALSGSDAEDDIQVLSARPDWLGLRLRCKLETAGRIVQFIRELGMDLPAAEQEQVSAAFREILLNAVEHGAGSDPGKKVIITYIRTKRAALYYVRDPGKGFSFDHLEHAAVSNPEDSPVEHAEFREKLGMRPGGFGILMTRELVDELIYNEHGNEVLLIKYLDRK
jgi:anti-sigma regulatory factor (Ser/Thr protein kinase)